MKMNFIYDSSYQERWRDVPDEARQPSIFIEMVPIHTKLLKLWQMRERFFHHAFLLTCRRAFLFLEISLLS
jgi:hypothetical protein